jgi:hypothetical protein
MESAGREKCGHGEFLHAVLAACRPFLYGIVWPRHTKFLADTFTARYRQSAYVTFSYVDPRYACNLLMVSFRRLVLRRSVHQPVSTD